MEIEENALMMDGDGLVDGGKRYYGVMPQALDRRPNRKKGGFPVVIPPALYPVHSFIHILVEPSLG